MRSPRRSRTPFVLAVALVALLASSCGVAAEQASTGPGGGGGGPTDPIDPLDPPVAGLPTSGHLPASAAGEPAARVRTCTVDPADPERALVEAVVVNHATQPQLMQSLPLTMRDGSGQVVSADEEDLWSSVRIGPGRRLLLRETVELDAAATTVTCTVGEPDLRADALPGGDDVAPADLRLTSCTPSIGVTVHNTSDRPVAVAVVVEVFDAAGFSAGSFELGQRPTTYTDGKAPGPDEVALPAGETGTYRVDPAERIADYGTALEGPVTSCQVLAATVVEDPETTQVIVD